MSVEDEKMDGGRDNVVGLDDYREWKAEHIACMNCGHDWVAAFRNGSEGYFECSDCGQMNGEVIDYENITWFSRFMDCPAPQRHKRTMVLLRAKMAREKGDV